MFEPIAAALAAARASDQQLHAIEKALRLQKTTDDPAVFEEHALRNSRPVNDVHHS
jgi:DNA-binding FadR family transcriptional regulator